MKPDSKIKELTGKCLLITDPFITTYTQHAHLLSILSGHERLQPWIFSNYIQLYINRDYIHNWGDFYFPCSYDLRPSDTCPWIHSQKIDRGLINRRWDSVTDFIIENINENNYIQIMVNCYYISVHERYKNENRMHDLFIYGYDLEREVLYASDFFNKGKYSNKEITFTDFNKAYSEYDSAINHDYLFGLVYMYRLNSDCNYIFNIQNIINSIDSYLTCRIPEYWDIFNREDLYRIVFGREIYATLKNYLQREIFTNESGFERRPFHLLYDHKKMMSLRIKFLYEQGVLDETIASNNIFRELEELARNIIYLLIKYQVSRKKSIVTDKIPSLLNEIEEKEFDCLSALVSSLRHSLHAK